MWGGGAMVPDGPEGGENGEDAGLSHDPRTWLQPAEAKPAAAPSPASVTSSGDPAAESFDPKTWLGAPPPSSPPSSGTSASSSGRRGPSRPVWIAAVVVVLAIAAGVGWLAMSRRAAAPGADAALPGVTASTANVERRVLSIADLSALEKALRDAGVIPAQAVAAAAAAQPLLGGPPGELRVEMGLQAGAEGAQLLELIVLRQDGSGAKIDRAQGAIRAAPIAADTKRVIRDAHGEMDADGFYSSAVTAGVNDSLIPEVAQAFAFDFDFQRELPAGSVFEAAWEERVNPQGQSIGVRHLLYVSMKTKDKTREFYRFTPPGETKEGWYDGYGKSVIRSLMRTPVDGARISSTYGWRVHPVLGFMKMHKGVDFAAPIGTPIYAVGDGVVTWAAMKGPDGNLVILRHPNGWETYYLHMSAYGAGVTAGASLRQGQVVGAIGVTGRSTGPHLHYEVHINNEAIDPGTAPVDEGKGLSGEALKAFQTERDRIDKARAAAG